MSLRALQRQWTILGEKDPYWAILTADGKQNGRWNVDEFFSTGVAEIRRVMAYVQTRHPLAYKRAALDFGCGAGRLTQALAAHFEHVSGVDISPPMIELARQNNRVPDRVEYVLNTRGDLLRFPSGHFDFIYSNITLQHMRRRLIRAYIPELVRVLAPGGVLLFQLPTTLRPGAGWRKKSLMQFLYRHFWWTFRRPLPYLEMHGLTSRKVEALIAGAGGRLLEALPNENAGPDWHSLAYLVVSAITPDAPTA
jgi:SAM-dependent methyltransferase